MAPSVVLVQGGEKSQHAKVTKETGERVEKHPGRPSNLSAAQTSRSSAFALVLSPIRHIMLVSVRSIVGLMQSISGANAMLMAVVSPCDSLFAEVPPGVKVRKAPLQN